VKPVQDRHIRLAIFIGVIAVAVRFIAINQPFVDEWSWRQSDVAAIARNFLTGGFHFARPQIDWAGDQPGYVGTELPIVPFVAALAYKIFGVHECIGRVEAVILFAASLPFFFLLVCDMFGTTAATCALFFYCFAPLSVMASRCFMPDMPSLSVSIIGLYFFQCWIAAAKSTSFFASAACISLSILLKAPAAIIGAPLAVAAVYDRRILRGDSSDGHRPPLQWLGLFAMIALLPSAIWYWHAYQISKEFYPHHFFGAGGFRFEQLSWYFAIVRGLFVSSLTPVLFILGIAGAIVARSTIKSRVLYAWLVAMILFIVVVGYGNRHPWYQLPLVPIAAAFAGEFCARVMSLRAFANPHSYAALFMRAGFAIVATTFAACSLMQSELLYRPVAAELREAGLELKRTTPPGSLIVAPDYGDPTIFYYAERRGWHFLECDGVYNGHPSSSEDAIVDLAQLRWRGATHLVFYSKTVWWLDEYKEFARYVEQNATLLESNAQFRIYRLK
jgi:4-amino-4-deoxy-L-arabinose transferase-like glycosyltransferase